MAEHLTTQQVEFLIARQLAPPDLLAATEHLADCTDCRHRINQAHQTFERLPALRAKLQAAPDLRHLSYEKLADYVDGLLSDEGRESVDHHLALCARCATEAQELIALRDELTALHTVPSYSHSPTLWEKLTHRWQLAYQWRPHLIASLVGVLLLVAASVSWLAWRARSSPVPQSAPSIPSTAASSSPVTPAAMQPMQLPAPAIIAALNDNAGQVTLDEQGKLSGLPALTPADEQLVKQALERHQVPRSAALDGLTSRASKLMSGRSEGVAFALLSPLSTVVNTARPTFRWQPLSEAVSYTVTVLDENFNVVIASEPLKETSWIISRPLPLGARYLWQVTARTNADQQITSPSTPAPEARFQVLGQVQAVELSRVAQIYRQSHLLLGLRYTQAGLLEDAEREWRALLTANPRSVIAKNLLQQVQALRR